MIRLDLSASFPRRGLAMQLMIARKRGGVQGNEAVARKTGRYTTVMACMRVLAVLICCAVVNEFVWDFRAHQSQRGAAAAINDGVTQNERDQDVDAVAAMPGLHGMMLFTLPAHVP